jgi:hypothetical protein
VERWANGCEGREVKRKGRRKRPKAMNENSITYASDPGKEKKYSI